MVIAVLAVVWITTFVWVLLTAHPTLIAASVFLGCLLLLFSSLTVVVADQTLQVFFSAGIIYRHIPLSRIRKVEVVQMPWYYGWGIRLTPHGWLWRISGLVAVQLTFDDGRRFNIGSDEPEKLAQVLQQETQGAG